MRVVRCISCDGFGWLERDSADYDLSDGAGVEGAEALECAWCGGIGYVCQDAQGHDHRIPPADLDALTDTLEALEAERLREMGYTGAAKKPWEQAVRRRDPDSSSHT